MNDNILLCTDVYKLGHMLFYPKNTTRIYSYMIARNNTIYNSCVFFGLQYYLKNYLSKFITKENVLEFLYYRKHILGTHSYEVENKLVNLLKLGYFPIHIKAIPEGTIIENKNALITITNTHPDFYWLPCFLESLLLKVWNTCSVATLSKKYKSLVELYYELTCDEDEVPHFQVHDFGYRGCSSEETAALSGAAHLINFLGTDTVPAVKLIHDFYGPHEGFIGLSVPATEHSIMSSYGENKEIECVERILDLNPTGIVSIVCDTYDLFNLIVLIGEKLKDKILNREGKVVFRPDSGDPLKIITGDPNSLNPIEKMGMLELLSSIYGFSINKKGYKVLNNKVGLIYGDAMYYRRYEEILTQMKLQGFAASNLVIGVGGILLQQHNRDDMGFSFKATYAEIDGKPVNLFKNPKTDSAKKSHQGLMMVSSILDNDGYHHFYTKDKCDWNYESKGCLQTVYKDGVLYNETTFSKIRALAKW